MEASVPPELFRFEDLGARALAPNPASTPSHRRMELISDARGGGGRGASQRAPLSLLFAGGRLNFSAPPPVESAVFPMRGRFNPRVNP